MPDIFLTLVSIQPSVAVQSNAYAETGERSQGSAALMKQNIYAKRRQKGAVPAATS